MPLMVEVDGFFDDAEDITDIGIPSGTEELVRTFKSVDHCQLEMTLGVIDILERGEWLAQVKRAEELVSLSVFESGGGRSLLSSAPKN